jgi:hypothetical protein
MKRILFTLFIFVFAQNVFGQGINFQGVARSANGTILANQRISLKLSIITGSNTSTPDYIETRSVATNAQGIFSIVVGDTGTISTIGTYASISWKTSNKFLKVEMDPNNGTNFISMGTTPLQYVPFSYYSNGVDAANVAGVLPVKSGGTGVASISDLKSALVLDKVNNTADIDKPISLLTQTALNTKLNKADTTGLSNRIDIKLNKADTAGLSNRIDIKLNKADTAGLSNRIDIKLNKADTAGLSNRIDAIIKTKEIILKDIIINGVNAGIGGGKSNSNTLFGYGSLQKNTTGQDNTAFGSYALSENFTGYNNTAVGSGALGSNTTGYLNTAIGRFALGSITSGNRNTSIGNGTLGLITDGVANTAIGFSALSKQTSFGPNDAFGSESQSNLTTGVHNTSFGQGTLRNNIIGGSNVAFGVSTLTNNLANYNSGFGANALLNNTTGEGNTAVGVQSLYNNTTASNNIAIGSKAMFSNTTGYSNTAIGTQSLWSNTTGYRNTAIGDSAFLTKTSFTNSTAIGYNAQITASNQIQLGDANVLLVKTTGSIAAGGSIYATSINAPLGTTTPNIGNFTTITTTLDSFKTNSLFFGKRGITNYVISGSTTTLINNTSGGGVQNFAVGPTLSKNSAGSGNTAVGLFVLNENTSGNGNSGVGFYSLMQNTTGRYNTAFGGSTLTNNTIGSDNISLGFQSLLNNTEGNDNVAIGLQSNWNNTLGNKNISIGNYSLISSMRGIGSIAIGHKAMMNAYYNIIGTITGNTAIGFESLMGDGNNRINIGQYNTAVGYQSLTSNTSGSNNTAIGYSAMSSSSTYSNSTALGYNAQVTASNQMQLGNNDITDVKTSGVITSGGLGIGNKSNTSAALEVNSSSQGFLPPRMTAAQRDNIVTPVAGLVVWCSNCAPFGELQVYNGSIWTNMIGGASTPPPVVITEADIIFKVVIAGAEVNYSGVLAVVGTSIVINANITSVLPKDGVTIDVSVKKRSDNTVVFTTNLSSSAASNPVTITGLTAGVLCEATVTVTSKSKASNTASKSFGLASK